MTIFLVKKWKSWLSLFLCSERLPTPKRDPDAYQSTRDGDVAQLVECRTSTPRWSMCGKGFFFQCQLSVQILLRCPHIPVCNRMHEQLCARWRSCGPCQRLVDYGHTKTPSMNRRLESAILLQLAFSGESKPNFTWEKFRWNNTVVKWKKKVKCVLEFIHL